MNDKNRKLTYILASAALCTALFAGCGNERNKEEMAYREAGIESMQKGDYESAAEAFDNSLQMHIGKITQTQIDTCYYKAAALYASGDKQGALETYNALVEYNPENADVYYMRGCLNLQTGEKEQALEDFSNAILYNPNEYELYVNIYQNLSAYNLKEDGETYLNKAFDIKGNEAANFAWRGRIYYLLGQYDNAEVELTTAIDKKHTQANLYLAQVYEARGESQKAENFYHMYVASGAADAAAMNALAEIEIEKGNYTEALSYIEQGLAMEEVPNEKELMKNEIVASEYAGDFVRAWETMKEYIKSYPEDEAAQREYIFLKYRQPYGAETEDSTEDTTQIPETETSETEVLEEPTE